MKKIYYSILFVFAIVVAALPTSAQENNNEGDTMITDDPNNYRFEFFGDGNIQKTLNDNEEVPANTGVGFRYLRQFPSAQHRKGKNSMTTVYDIEAQINIASNADTIIADLDSNGNVSNQADFGSFMLLPTNSGQAAKFSWMVRREGQKKNFWGIDGFHFRFAAANQFFSKNNVSIKGSAISYYFGAFWEFIPRFNDCINREYSIMVRLGFGSRNLAGNLASETPGSRALRKELIGATRHNYYGPEMGIALRVKNLRAEFSIPWMFAREKNNPVPGLNGAQFNTAISFIGGFPIGSRQ
ncbi:MAG: hypothetical protein IPO27_17905 [Bacteroidetes bacterium]|nr:hypothetical protein [Bacteroidota bacterium]